MSMKVGAAMAVMAPEMIWSPMRGSMGNVPNQMVLVVEEWAPECLMAVPVLRECQTANEFEQAAMVWLEGHEQEIARQTAADRGMQLERWWHDPDWAGDSPFGATIMLLSTGDSGTEIPPVFGTSYPMVP